MNSFLLVSGCLSSSVKLCRCQTLPLLLSGPWQLSILSYCFGSIQSRSLLNKPEVPKRNHIRLLVRFSSCSVAYHPIAPYRGSKSDFWLLGQKDQRTAHQILALITLYSSSFCNTHVSIEHWPFLPCINRWFEIKPVYNVRGADHVKKGEEDVYQNFRWLNASSVFCTHPSG